MSIQFLLDDGTFYNDFDFVGNTQNPWELSSPDYGITNTIVDNSENDGSVKVGDSRIKSPRISLSGKYAFTDIDEYNTKINTLLDAFNRTVYIYNTDEDLRTKVTPIGATIPHVKGCRKGTGDYNLRFEMTEACWEDSDLIIETPLVLAANTADTVTIDAGYKQTFLLISFEASVACDEITIVNEKNNQVSIIEDPLFGTTVDDLEMDNVVGTLLLGSVDRKEYFVAGTGFFRLASGENTIQFLTNAACTVNISYRKRYFE